MRTFLRIMSDKFKDDDVANMSSNFGLWHKNAIIDGRPNTRDPAYWEDWIDSIAITFKIYRIDQNYRDVEYNEQLAFFCFHGYLKHYVDMFKFEGIVELLDKFNCAELVKGDFIWDLWIQSIEHVLNGTYELDVYYDPFTYERLD